MSGYYIEVDGVPQAVEDVLVWGRWFESANRQVRDTRINGVRISTVFLGLDHRFLGDGPPVLYETMVFGGLQDQEQQRYSTRAAAIKGHKRMERAVRLAQAQAQR